MKLQNVSLDHIARLAGVHKSTVSRALRNHPTIPPATRKRIQEIARREGYCPNPLVAIYQAHARSNRPTSAQSALAWINDNRSGPPSCCREFPWLPKYLRGARQRCESLGFRLEEISIGENQREGIVERSRISETLRKRRIFGAILPPTLRHYHDDWSDCVVARIGRSGGHAHGAKETVPCNFYPRGCPAVDHDSYSNMRLAFQTVLQRGYSRVGFIYTRYRDSESEGRAKAGFLVEQSQIPASSHIPVLFLECFKKTRPTSFDRWMDKHNPDVILSISPIIRDWVRQSGRSVPDQCGLVHLNIAEDAENWSGIRENHELIGAAAVDILIGQLTRREIGISKLPRKMLIPGEWHEGATLRDPPARVL